MKQTLTIIQIILSISLIALILVQARGTGFGRGNSSFTRRGLEKLIYKMTFFVAALFLLNAVLLLTV